MGTVSSKNEIIDDSTCHKEDEVSSEAPSSTKSDQSTEFINKKSSKSILIPTLDLKEIIKTQPSVHTSTMQSEEKSCFEMWKTSNLLALFCIDPIPTKADKLLITNGPDVNTIFNRSVGKRQNA